MVISIIGNVYLFTFWQRNQSKMVRMIDFAKAYPLESQNSANPIVGENLIVNFLPLRSVLHSMTDPYSDNFALFFEFLPTGTSIGINAESEFTAESLLKVPVVMAYFYEKEQLHITSDPTVTIAPNELNSTFGDLYKKGAGYRISLATAVQLALEDSDNTASLIIADHINNPDFNYVYQGLDIPMRLSGQSPIITAQEYASILKSLYFNSVLSDADSEKILKCSRIQNMPT